MPYIVSTPIMRTCHSYRRPQIVHSEFNIENEWVKKEEDSMEWEKARYHTGGFDKN